MNAPTMAVRRELEPRQRVYRDGVWLDSVHVAKDHRCVALREHPADAIAKPRQIVACDRAAHGERDGVCHRLLDGAAGECSSRPMSFKTEDGLTLR